jgi:dTMP kinase
MKKGVFIAFEGPDGSGKSTISQMVYNILLSEGLPVIWTREPGGIGIAEKIRDLILDPQNTNMDARCEALLYAASRRQHLVEKVIPALHQGHIVLCDRFVDSSLAYQGYGRGLGYEAVGMINDFAIEGYYPDLTVFLNVAVQVGLDRLKEREHKDRLDLESLSFHEKVFAGYEAILNEHRSDYVIVDANQSIDTVAQLSLTAIKKFLYE